jgi:hypothetical protein
MHAYIKYRKANIKHFLADGRIRVSLRSHLNHPRVRHDAGSDYKAHYYANHRAFFILFALLVPVDIVDSLLKGVHHVLA